MKRFILLLALGLSLSLLLIECGEKNPLPTGPKDVGSSLSAGDTVFTRLKPDWPLDNRVLQDPRDIVINRDGYIFVAEAGANRVTVFNKSGTVIESEDAFGNKHFDELANIPTYPNQSGIVKPVGVAIDSRMNLFIVDSSNTVYVWNQFINNVGVDSVATGFVLADTSNGQTITVSADDYWRSNYRQYTIQRSIWSADPARIDSVTKPRMFFTTQLPEMLQENYGSQPQASSFSAVATYEPQNLLSPDREGSIYLTDASFYSRIIRVDYRKYRLVKLGTGNTFWLYRGKYRSIVAVKGHGAGTVNDPTGVFFGYYQQDPTLYFSQTGENYGAHKISLSTGDFDLAESADMMQLGRLVGVQDISADANGNIFVTNTANNVIEEFNPNGKFLRYVAATEVIVDTVLSDTTVVNDSTYVTTTDTSYVEYIPNILNDPKSVAESDGVVYIADTGNNRIVRYKLSTDVQINLGEQQY